MTERLDFALIERLRGVLGDQPVTEAELRSLSEQAGGWARTLEGQIHASERRLRELADDPASSLADIAAELRRVETLGPELAELRSLLAELEARDDQPLSYSESSALRRGDLSQVRNRAVLQGDRVCAPHGP